MDTSTGGELVCYLSELDNRGNIPDPRSTIMLKSEDMPPATRCVRIGASGDKESRFDELAPRPGESLEDYRVRLEGPACRTAAWHIALLSENGPIVLDLSGHLADDPYASALRDYIRGLLA